ncbi:MAG TPA: hypothetical protein PKE47_14710, partial [Verrucomicrobiota bacterium]|nr:hypothetical protein [Verrucomicrobiota bacterium]
MNLSPWPVLLAGLLMLPVRAAEAPAGELPRDSSGRALNLDFEAGDLRDWDPQGEAFANQPRRGDTARARRPAT